MSEDGCVEVYTAEGFEEMTQDVAVASRTTLEGRQSRRQFYGHAFDAELDRQGRILVPQALRQQAGLDGPVVIMGCLECMEIWNPERRRRFEEAHLTSPSAQGSSE
jgi:MraZ protein